MRPGVPTALRPLLLGALFAGLAWVIVACAWQSDDAYITFRTVENLWSGRGLTWNPGERVQAYTHPLWLLVAAVGRGLAGEVYFSTLAASILLSLAAAGLVVSAVRREAWAAALALVLLGSSGAFVDYATSGLETPLLYLLLALFLRRGRAADSPGGLLRAGLLAAAVGLTRLDALLIVLPALAGAWWQCRPRRVATAAVAAGLSPLVAWELFSLVYYGALVPNTALAKLNLEIPLRELLSQGAAYFRDSLARDPVTLVATLGALGLAARRGTRFQGLFAAGVLLYLVYIARIGGDFMSGRFFAAPFLAAVALLAQLVADRPPGGRFLRRAAPALLAALLLFGFLWPGSRWLSGASYGSDLAYSEIVGATGIADERANFYPTTGLLPVLGRWASLRESGTPIPPYPGALHGRRLAQSAVSVAVWNEAGFFGYFAGPERTVIDVWGLCDPLLARIPYRPAGAWRVGHYERRLPAGYLESRRSGVNRLEDPGLAALYEGLRVVVGGPLLSSRRWREIWRLNTGHYARVLRTAH